MVLFHGIHIKNKSCSNLTNYLSFVRVNHYNKDYISSRMNSKNTKVFIKITNVRFKIILLIVGHHTSNK
jgi:hypothetical protein